MTDQTHDEILRLNLVDAIRKLRLLDLLAERHTGTRISADGILGRIRDGRYYKELNFGCGEMLRHLEEMASRFYAGDVKAVDEFLQLYDLDEHRPSV